MKNSTNTYDFVIVGAGAAGLFAAVLLHQRGYSVCVLDKKPEASTHSRSIGIHPPSLQLLDEAGLLPAFFDCGVRVSHGRAIVTAINADGNHHVTRNRELKLCSGEHTDVILVVPQFETERILAASLPEGVIHRGQHVTGFRDTGDGVEVRLEGDDRLIRGRFLLAADGMHSALRKMAGITWDGSTYESPFCMGDFPDNTPYGEEAVIYLTPEGLVESFPLPGGKRRWVINLHPDTAITDDNSEKGRWHSTQTAAPSNPERICSEVVAQQTAVPSSLERICSEIPTQQTATPSATQRTTAQSAARRTAEEFAHIVHRRTGYTLDLTQMDVFSSFRVHRYSASSSVKGRLILLGDAAHVISPIGGQGMNFGWMNIRALVDFIHKDEGNASLHRSDLARYNRLALANARKYGNRAHFNTRIGLPGSHHKTLAWLTDILLHPFLSGYFARRFTMR